MSSQSPRGKLCHGHWFWQLAGSYNPALLSKSSAHTAQTGHRKYTDLMLTFEKREVRILKSKNSVVVSGYAYSGRRTPGLMKLGQG
jgi:hypothetical protein